MSQALSGFQTQNPSAASGLLMLAVTDAFELSASAEVKRLIPAEKVDFWAAMTRLVYGFPLQVPAELREKLSRSRTLASFFGYAGTRAIDRLQEIGGARAYGAIARAVSIHVRSPDSRFISEAAFSALENPKRQNIVFAEEAMDAALNDFQTSPMRDVNGGERGSSRDTLDRLQRLLSERKCGALLRRPTKPRKLRIKTHRDGEP